MAMKLKYQRSTSRVCLTEIVPLVLLLAILVVKIIYFKPLELAVVERVLSEFPLTKNYGFCAMPAISNNEIVSNEVRKKLTTTEFYSLCTAIMANPSIKFVDDKYIMVEGEMLETETYIVYDRKDKVCVFHTPRDYWKAYQLKKTLEAFPKS